MQHVNGVVIPGTSVRPVSLCNSQVTFSVVTVTHWFKVVHPTGTATVYKIKSNKIQLLPSYKMNIESCQPEGGCIPRGENCTS